MRRAAQRRAKELTPYSLQNNFLKDRLLNIVPNAQESDTTGDATKNCGR